jgi:hypothetical protein
MLKNDKKDIRQILTANGELAIPRTVLRPCDNVSAERLMDIEGVKSIVPLDILLRIHDLPFKMTRKLMCETAFWAQNQHSFREAAVMLQRYHGVNISEKTVRTVAEHVGKIVFEQDTLEANLANNNVQQESKKVKSKDGILYIQADGSMLNTRTENSENAKYSTWREVKLGLVFSSDNIKKRVSKNGEEHSQILKKEYTGYIGSSDKFKEYLYACALRNGYGVYKNTVFLSDGALCLRNIAEEKFPDAELVLDFFHACENTYDYAKALFKNDEFKYKPWAEDIIEKLKDGKKKKVITILEPFSDFKPPQGVVNLYNYFLSNYDRIDYKEYREKGYYIGSGAIESSHNVVFQRRMKLAGMRWEEEYAQYLLSLRAKCESSLWDSFVVALIMSYDYSQ